MSGNPIEQLRRSWISNAETWTAAVREGHIESRRVVTDAAIVEALLARTPRRVLDVGCGEGWLCRTLAAHGIEAVGVDASAPLIDAARSLGGAQYEVASYDDLASRSERLGRFDALVCNFALLEAEIAPLLRALRGMLRPAGVLVIQTVHPWAAAGEGPYRDGWRTETFAGFGQSFREPMPWFFRTLASWTSVLRESGWRIEDLHEPVHPETARPLSLLLIAAPAAA
jgi:2-polyprenyl-3-methyl-5-hydroxy-6-metoxy-1,4-benzoquinol methylase